MLPAEQQRAVATSADTGLTLEQAYAQCGQVALPREKERRYAMYVPLANGFWNTVRDVLTHTSHAPGATTAQYQAGNDAVEVPAAGTGQDDVALNRILLYTSHAYGTALSEALQALPGPIDDQRTYFQHACERVLSGSHEGGMLVTEVMKTLLKYHQEKTGQPLAPDDLDRNAVSQLSQVKKIMQLNIVADEFLDALMYGNADLFTCEEVEGKAPSYAITLREDVAQLFEGLANDLCVGRAGQPLAVDDLFEEIHGRVRAHLGGRYACTPTDVQLGMFLGALAQLQDVAIAADENPDDVHRLLQGLELSFIYRKAEVPIETWPPVHREFMMTSLLLKSIVAWHTEPGIRTVSGCPMLYSRMLPDWYAKLTGAMRDWYRKTLVTQGS